MESLERASATGDFIPTDAVFKRLEDRLAAAVASVGKKVPV